MRRRQARCHAEGRQTRRAPALQGRPAPVPLAPMPIVASPGARRTPHLLKRLLASSLLPTQFRVHTLQTLFPHQALDLLLQALAFAEADAPAVGDGLPPGFQTAG